MEVLNLGLIDYAEALKIQEASVEAKEEKLIICEHTLVVTVGRAINARAEVFSKEIPIFEITRGGRATLHLPGQLVCYPILNLERRGRDLHAYMRLLESAIIDTLADFRIEAQSIQGKTGVWVEKSKNGGTSKKIASLGIAVKKGMSYHGVALNVDCDLTQFRALNPCGFSADVMTSMREELHDNYLREWVQVIRRLKKDVSKRLIENLQTRLEDQIEQKK